MITITIIIDCLPITNSGCQNVLEMTTRNTQIAPGLEGFPVQLTLNRITCETNLSQQSAQSKRRVKNFKENQNIYVRQTNSFKMKVRDCFGENMITPEIHPKQKRGWQNRT